MCNFPIYSSQHNMNLQIKVNDSYKPYLSLLSTVDSIHTVLYRALVKYFHFQFSKQNKGKIVTTSSGMSYKIQNNNNMYYEGQRTAFVQKYQVKQFYATLLILINDHLCTSDLIT